MATSPTSSTATKYLRRLVMGNRKAEGDKTTTLVTSPDSRTIYFQQGGHIQLVRTHDGQPNRHNKFTVPSDSQFIISPNSTKILIWSLASAKQKFVNLLDFLTGQMILGLPGSGLLGGKQLIVTSDWKKVVILGDTNVKVWSLESGEQIHPLQASGKEHDTAIGYMAISRDNKKLLGLSRSRALLWDIKGKQLLQSIDLSVKDDPHYCLYHPLKATLSADWRFLFVRHNFGNALKVVHLDTGKVIKSISDPATTMNALTVTPNGHFLVSSDQIYPDTITTGKIFMTIWDLKKLLKDKWGENRGTFVGTLDKNGKRNGRGKAYLPDKSVYEGNWEDDLRSGKGECTYQDGSLYQGDWKDDMREGQGIIIFADRSQYEGTWVADGREGAGVMKYNDGSRYQGKWKDDRRHGQGEFWSCFGSLHKGEWLADRRDGYGACTYPDGSRYDGLWKKELWHCRGVLYYPDGSRYEGEFKKGKQEGYGRLFDSHGKLSYEGHWSDNMKNGHGILYTPSGSIKYQGYWKDDEKTKKPAIDPPKAVSGAGKTPPRSSTKSPVAPSPPSSSPSSVEGGTTTTMMSFLSISSSPMKKAGSGHGSKRKMSILLSLLGLSLVMALLAVIVGVYLDLTSKQTDREAVTAVVEKAVTWVKQQVSSAFVGRGQSLASSEAAAVPSTKIFSRWA